MPNPKPRPYAASEAAPAMLVTHVLYHADCADGFGAAWAAWRALRADAPRFYPARSGDAPPPIQAGDTLYILDFSYPRPVVEQLLALVGAPRFFLLDHHQTAAEALSGVPNCLIDSTRSGAILAWRFFHGSEPPDLLKYVEDRDLWRWALSGSREINAAIRSWPFEFETWDRLAGELESLERDGTAIIRAQARLVDAAAREVQWFDFGDGPVPGVNSSLLVSEIGALLLTRDTESPYVAVYRDRQDGQRVWDLRGRPDGLPVNRIAERFGGGGHPQAAGFVLAPEPGPGAVGHVTPAPQPRPRRRRR